MFQNIGGKIKGLAKFFFVIGLIGSVVGAIVLYIEASEASRLLEKTYTIWATIVLICGPLLSWIGNISLYGFGELISQTMEINRRLEKSGIRLSTVTKSYDPCEHDEQSADDTFCGAEISTCELCNAENVAVVNCKIVDEYGVRYRKICAKCMAEKHATQVK